MQRKWLILTAVSLGSLMATLDGSIVNIALPAIQTDFGIDLTTIEWVVVAYLLVVGSLLLPFGRLGEVLTFKRVYVSGFAHGPTSRPAPDTWVASTLPTPVARPSGHQTATTRPTTRPTGTVPPPGSPR